MKALLVVAFTLFCFALGEKVRYDGYQVLRVKLNDTNYRPFMYLADKLLLDVWATNRIQGWADVMVPPMRAAVFDESFEYQVRIENVQTTLDEHYADMDSVKPSDDPTDHPIFNNFPTTGQVNNFLNEQLANHPGVATRVVLGTTYEGNQIAGLRLGSNSLPLVFFHCTIHAREWITTTTCLWIIDQILNDDPEGRALLDHVQFIIVPILNLDGYDFTHTSNRLWRKNREPNSGSTCIGTDLNRNYSYGWGGDGSSPSACADTYRGATPFSSPEITAQRNFLAPYLNAGNVPVFVDIHAYGAMFMSPWGYTYTLPPASDYNDMYAKMENACNEIYAENGRTYAYGSVGNVIYLASGGSNDWGYGDGGVVHAYAIETFGSSFTPPASWIRPMGAEIYRGLKQLVIDVVIGSK